MYWQKRFNRVNPDQELEEVMILIHDEHKDYGYRRMQQELKRKGYIVNKKKVQRLMRKLDIRVESFTRKSRRYSSYKGKVGKVTKNLLKRRFKTNITHQKITTDTTEFKYYDRNNNGIINQKKLYLNPFLDMFNGEVISYRISQAPTFEPIEEAMKEAIEKTSDCIYRRTFHSDQGWAYQMKKYGKVLKENKIFQSMSRKGNCIDNSPMENFFGLLKQEMYYGKTFQSYEELKEAIDNYINYYNEKRIKEKLGWLSPIEYREKHKKLEAA